ncbi:HD domain-containing protein [Candidatus Tisiphia endosymbiont of Hybos culiciformis]|uniref:HD domain-containing protein n=1 Tax=Candidatus Tisiphia endosymbiont of Hybos culiciformis TaxID=3139331 RepID=UPI003CCB1959
MEDIHNWQTKYASCHYADRLLNKLIQMNKEVNRPINIDEVKKAIYYAKKYHGSQMRQSGEPYYSHPIEVAYMTSDYLFRTDIIVTSILHDTIEDTELSRNMIAIIFGEQVATQVMDLTRIKEDGRKISSAEMVESLFEQKKYEGLLVKQFDRLHNMQTIGAKSPEKVQKILDETLKIFLSLPAYLNTLDIEKNIAKFCFLASKGSDANYIQRNFSFLGSSQPSFLKFQNETSQIYNPKL